MLIKESFQNILFCLQSLLTIFVDTDTISIESNNKMSDTTHISLEKFDQNINPSFHPSEKTKVNRDGKLNTITNKSNKFHSEMDLGTQIPDMKDSSTDLGKEKNVNLNPNLIVISIEESFEILFSNMKEISNIFDTKSAGEELVCEILRSCTIVFCTLTSSGSSIIKNNIYNLDFLVVDEAAQSLEVELLIPFALGPKNLILVGDPHQLPACVLSIDNQKLKRGESLMQRLIERCNYPYMLLDTQYRMHQAISLLPNKLFYNGKLIDSTYVIKRKNIIEWDNIDNKNIIVDNNDIENNNVINNDNKNNNDNSDAINDKKKKNSKNKINKKTINLINDNSEIIISKSKNENENILWMNSIPKWLQYYSFLDVSGNYGFDGHKYAGERGGGNGGMSLSNEAEASVVVR